MQPRNSRLAQWAALQVIERALTSRACDREHGLAPYAFVRSVWFQRRAYKVRGDSEPEVILEDSGK